MSHSLMNWETDSKESPQVLKFQVPKSKPDGRSELKLGFSNISSWGQRWCNGEEPWEAGH